LFKGERVQKPEDPVKSGCNFLGWSVYSGTYTYSEIFSEQYNFDFVPLGDMTLIANWNDDDNTEKITPDVVVDINSLKDYLEKLQASEGNLNNPVRIELKINNDDELKQIKDILNNAKKYVELDLSKYATIYSIPAMVFSNPAVATAGDSSTKPYAGCEYLTGIILPDSVKSIGDSAFANCANLTKIIIPEKVETIEKNAFTYCDKLTSVTFKGIIPAGSFSTNAFDGNLYEKYFGGVTPPVTGMPGTYIATINPNGKTWSKQ